MPYKFWRSNYDSCIQGRRFPSELSSGNPMKPYCFLVIQPRLNKLAKQFTDNLKP